MNVNSFAAIAVGVAVLFLVAFDYATPADRIETVLYKRPTLQQVRSEIVRGLREIEGEKPACSPWVPMPELVR